MNFREAFLVLVHAIPGGRGLLTQSCGSPSTLLDPFPLRSMGSPLLLWESATPSDERSQAFDNHAIWCCWLQLSQFLMFNLRARAGGNWEESPLALLLRNTQNYTGFHTIPIIHTISQRQHGALQPFKLPLCSRHEWEGI